MMGRRFRRAAMAAALLAFAPMAAAAAPKAALAEIAVGSLQSGQAESLWRLMAAADMVGLDPGDYLDPTLAAQLSSTDAAARRAGEASLVNAAVRFAGNLRTGRTPTARFRSDWAIRPSSYDAREELAAALASDRLEAWASGLAPPHPSYRQLLTELARYRQIEAQGGWKALDPRRTLKLGVEHDAVLALRERLVAEAGGASSSDKPRLFDPTVKELLSRFQASHGLTPTGEADLATLQALNVPVAARIASIRASLERWRWLPRTLPSTRVEVNVAAAELRVFDADRPTLAMRTVVGRPADPTPMFADEIEAVVFNPPWNVPQGITEREILPKAQRDPGYLAREGFIWIEDGPARRLQQKPGPTSALGLYKFDLPNRFSVYLHDTPLRTVFNLDRRTLSHGCIRLEQPRALALWLLNRQGFDAAAIDRSVAAGATSSVRLAQPVPVFLLYWTAFVSDDGVLNFRDDVYGWDRRLLAN